MSNFKLAAYLIACKSTNSKSRKAVEKEIYFILTSIDNKKNYLQQNLHDFNSLEDLDSKLSKALKTGSNKKLNLIDLKDSILFASIFIIYSNSIGKNCLKYITEHFNQYSSLCVSLCRLEQMDLLDIKVLFKVKHKILDNIDQQFLSIFKDVSGFAEYIDAQTFLKLIAVRNICFQNSSLESYKIVYGKVKQYFPDNDRINDYIEHLFCNVFDLDTLPFALNDISLKEVLSEIYLDSYPNNLNINYPYTMMFKTISYLKKNKTFTKQDISSLYEGILDQLDTNNEDDQIRYILTIFDQYHTYKILNTFDFNNIDNSLQRIYKLYSFAETHVEQDLKDHPKELSLFGKNLISFFESMLNFADHHSTKEISIEILHKIITPKFVSMFKKYDIFYDNKHQGSTVHNFLHLISIENYALLNLLQLDKFLDNYTAQKHESFKNCYNIILSLYFKYNLVQPKLELRIKYYEDLINYIEKQTFSINFCEYVNPIFNDVINNYSAIKPEDINGNINFNKMLNLAIKNLVLDQTNYFTHHNKHVIIAIAHKHNITLPENIKFGIFNDFHYFLRGYISHAYIEFTETISRSILLNKSHCFGDDITFINLEIYDALNIIYGEFIKNNRQFELNHNIKNTCLELCQMDTLTMKLPIAKKSVKKLVSYNLTYESRPVEFYKFILEAYEIYKNSKIFFAGVDVTLPLDLKETNKDADLMFKQIKSKYDRVSITLNALESKPKLQRSNTQQLVNTLPTMERRNSVTNLWREKLGQTIKLNEPIKYGNKPIKIDNFENENFEQHSLKDLVIIPVHRSKGESKYFVAIDPRLKLPQCFYDTLNHVKENGFCKKHEDGILKSGKFMRFRPKGGANMKERLTVSHVFKTSKNQKLFVFGVDRNHYQGL